jgi:hypothetical protein
LRRRSQSINMRKHEIIIVIFHYMACFICLQDGHFVHKLNKQNVYRTKCKCNGCIHIDCLTIWYNSNQKCPICRIQVEPPKKHFTHLLQQKCKNCLMIMNYVAINGIFCLLICGILIQQIVFSTISFFIPVSCSFSLTSIR